MQAPIQHPAILTPGISGHWDQVAPPATETPHAVTHITRPRRHAPTPRSGAAHAAPAPAAAATEAQTDYPKTEEPVSYAVFDSLSDIVCVTTGDGTLRFLNRAGRDLLGYSDDDTSLIGSLFPAHTPAARQLLLDEVLPAVLRRGAVTCDTALQTADGRVFPASQTVVVTRLGGAAHSLTIVIRDVSIERQSAARLGESQRLFEMITRSSPDLIYLYDPQDERIVWMNRCPHAFLGGTERDARTLDSREMHQFVHPDDRAQFRATGSLMAAAYSDTDVLGVELRVSTAGGSWRWIHTRACVFSRRETGAPLLLLGVATDISTRKKSEHKLEVARDEAEHASRVKNEFLSRISHQFRAAMHDMIGTASAVYADREQRLTARELEQLGDMIQRATQLLGTVSDLHDYLRIDAGEMSVHQALVDARELIRETVSAFAERSARSRTAITVRLPEAAAPILTDPQRLRQALSHLVANALDVSGDGCVTVTLHVDDARGQPVAIDVQDSSAGITESLQDSVFYPFRIPTYPTPSAVRATGTTGLGLSVARAICEMLGCSLSLAQSSGIAGATFRITLPLVSRAAALAAQYLVSPDESGGNVTEGRKVISSV